MKVGIKTSGGIANLRLQGQVDTKELPDEKRRRIEQALDSRKVAGGQGQADPHAADMRTFQVTVFDDEQSGGRSYTIDEGAADPEVVDALDELLQEVIRKKKG